MQYEGLQNIYFVCGHYGHRDNAPKVAQISEMRLEPSFKGNSPVESTYGPWMITKTRYIKGSQSHKHNTGNIGSRFAILSDMIEVDNMPMQTITNKESTLEENNVRDIRSKFTTNMKADKGKKVGLTASSSRTVLSDPKPDFNTSEYLFPNQTVERTPTILDPK